MELKEKQISYTATNTYCALNILSEKTKNVWIVFHGIGFLSRYFIKYFNELPKEENYIIAPQAPSKYYLNKDLETGNVLNYIDNLLASEKIPAHCRLIVLGFSQGVSIAARWTAKSKIDLDQLIFYAGGIPEELTPEDFKFLLTKNAKIKLVLGNKDEFISESRLQREKEKLKSLFNGKAELINFDGGHEIKKDILINLIT